MSSDEFLVGGVALTLAFVCVLISVGGWEQPYRIRSVAIMQTRYGKTAARMMWLVVAIVLSASGVAILNGVRPSYAIPAIEASIE